MSQSAEFLYGGARALTELHDRRLRDFFRTWQRAKGAQLDLPQDPDPDYESLDHLLRHVLACAAGYMNWMCKCLELDDPRIDGCPPVEEIAEEGEAFMDHVLDRWQTPLQRVEEVRFNRPTYKTNWNVEYCIDAMMEHAVMHPIRHEFQLQKLMGE